MSSVKKFMILISALDKNWWKISLKKYLNFFLFFFSRKTNIIFGKGSIHFELLQHSDKNSRKIRVSLNTTSSLFHVNFFKIFFLISRRESTLSWNITPENVLKNLVKTHVFYSQNFQQKKYHTLLILYTILKHVSKRKTK